MRAKFYGLALLWKAFSGLFVCLFSGLLKQILGFECFCSEYLLSLVFEPDMACFGGIG